VALFLGDGVQMIIVAFVQLSGLLDAGHATQPQCYAGHDDAPEPT
jgi:hypothetical protein